MSNDEPDANSWQELRGPRGRASSHRAEVLASTRCGCFYCCAHFRPDAILEWIDEDKDGEGQTALCPHCGVDAVIGDKSGVDLSDDFLLRLHRRWFA